MMGSTCIKIPADPANPTPQAGMDRVAWRQRTHLLQQQGKQDREKTHGRIITSVGARFMRSNRCQADRKR
jgi:hypothetical protein